MNTYLSSTRRRMSMVFLSAYVSEKLRAKGKICKAKRRRCAYSEHITPPAFSELISFQAVPRTTVSGVQSQLWWRMCRNHILSTQARACHEACTVHHSCSDMRKYRARGPRPLKGGFCARWLSMSHHVVVHGTRRGFRGQQRVSGPPGQCRYGGTR